MGFVSRFFGNRKPASSSGTPPNVLVADFGEVLATRSPVPGSVADVTELPYPKDEIKRAILVMLAATTDTPLREHLKFAYVSLADWQVGVGSLHQGLDVMKLDRTRPVSDLAKEVVAGGEQMQKWQPLAKAEQEALIGELRQLGFW
jgi:hypothetical protein